MLYENTAPPSYETTVTELKAEKSYRLYLHYKQSDTFCSQNLKSTIKIHNKIKFITENIPKHSIHPRNVPIEEVIKAFDPNKYLTIVLEHNNLEELNQGLEIYTSHKYWNAESYMPKKFKLTHEYPRKCVNRIAGNGGEKVVVTLLVLAYSKFHTKTNLITTFIEFEPAKSGNKLVKPSYYDPFHPPKPHGYVLYIHFPAKGMKVEDSITSKGPVKTFTFPEPANIAYISGMKSGTKNSRTKAICREPSVHFIIESLDYPYLREIWNCFINTETPNNRQYNLSILSFSHESLLSVKEDIGARHFLPDGLKDSYTQVAAMLTKQTCVYHPQISFYVPSDEPSKPKAILF